MNQNQPESVLTSINNVPFSPTSQVAMSHVAMSQYMDGQKYEIDTRNFIGKSCAGNSGRKASNNEDWMSRANPAGRIKRPMSHMTDDSLEPMRDSKEGPNKIDDSQSAPIQEERIIDYKDAILNKFTKRTNDRIVLEQKRDSSMLSNKNECD